MKNWIEKEICIAEIQTLLENDYEIEVDSPDGWVGVDFFVDKGEWDEYLLRSKRGDISCNENHLFQTSEGWKYSKDMLNGVWKVLTDTGDWAEATVHKTNKKIPIVDIQVNHENHRYYTNGISSHNTGVGKSLFMCHVAASCLSQGYNVLYITLEMAEERIAERIDANLLNIPLDDLTKMTKFEYDKRFNSLKNNVQGKLIIKEYPTASASSLHFRSLLNELQLKKNFKPQIIFIDYLNICTSSRIKHGSNVNSYSYIKSIAEELRGLAVEFDLPIVSATQTTRSGFCLDPNSIVIEKNGEKKLSDVVLGDQLLSNLGWNTVKKVYPNSLKKMYRITTEDGSSIIASQDHFFPTETGEKNILNGLCVGDKLFIRKIS